jgi:hypothetical protein
MEHIRVPVVILRLIVPALLVGAAWADAQTSALPRVSVPTGSAQYQPVSPAAPVTRTIYPWKTRITCTVFWIGERPTQNNPTPNCKSSWDQQWAANFGGYDDPEPSNRIANHALGEFRPKGFVPKLNPFYVALPYNDVINHRAHKPEAARVIPWFSRMRPEPGDTVCKGRWLQIYRNGRSCYAQWEDCGPWVTDDWEYVFGNKPPKNPQNGQAGLDISPAVRDFFDLKSGQKVHWRFVDDGQVPYGPWKKYGQSNNPVVANSDLALQQRRLDQLRRLRDEEFVKKPLSQIQN